MMAPDRPAATSPLDHGRDSDGSGIDETTTSMAPDVTPRRISTEYGLSRAVKTRSINRRPPANRLTSGRPGGTYLYWTRSRCTRARVAAETSARSLSTLDTVASDTPAAVATVSRVGRPSLGHCSAPFRCRSSRRTGQARHQRRVSRKVSMIARSRSQNRIRPREAGSSMPVKYFARTVDRTKRGSYCAPERKFRTLPKTSRRTPDRRLTSARARASCADRQSSRQAALAEDVMIGLRAAFRQDPPTYDCLSKGALRW